MIDTLARLVAIRETAKDIHYSANGDSFYGIHLLMDRVADDIDSQIDSIKEICFLGVNTLPPKSHEILSKAMDFIPNSDNWKANLVVLQQIIIDTITHIEALDLDMADANLIGGIAESLKLKLGLISRTVIK